MGLLVFAALGLTFLALPVRSRAVVDRFVDALLIWGVAVVALTEGLSLVRLITPGVALVTWAAICAGLVVWLAVRRINLRACLVPIEPSWLGEFPVIAGGIGALLGVVLLTALSGAPNYWDGLTYHLPRVMM